MTGFRRSCLVSLVGLWMLGGILAGCSFYREPPPVVVGGAAVAKSETVMAALRASSEHKRFVAALDASGVAETLRGIGPLTVFAPTDEAFATLRPKAAAAQMAEDPEFLERVLLGHVLRTRLTTEDLFEDFAQLNGSTKVFAVNQQVVRLSGEPAAPKLYDMRRRVVQATVTDALASNGVIHVIDGILLPEKDKPEP